MTTPTTILTPTTAAARLIDAMGQALDDLFNRLSKLDEFQVQP